MEPIQDGNTLTYRRATTAFDGCVQVIRPDREGLLPDLPYTAGEDLQLNLRATRIKPGVEVVGLNTIAFLVQGEACRLQACEFKVEGRGHAPQEDGLRLDLVLQGPAFVAVTNMYYRVAPMGGGREADLIVFNPYRQALYEPLFDIRTVFNDSAPSEIIFPD